MSYDNYYKIGRTLLDMNYQILKAEERHHLALEIEAHKQVNRQTYIIIFIE
jgi:hypothetical protein